MELRDRHKRYKNMKRTFNFRLIVISTVALLTISCENQPVDFPDFDKQAVYFPIQYPVRTLVLGEDRLDNSIDREKAFSVGVAIGGMYENKQDWLIDFEVDTILAQNLEGIDIFNNLVRIKVLPKEYYSINPASTIVIPKGSFQGKARVQLSEDFFNNPNAHKFYYVLPLRIVNTNAQSIITGLPAFGITNPNRHVISDYESNKMPKDFTLFAVKYINPWHGNFFHRGKQYKNDILDRTFHAEDLESNTIAELSTIGYKQILYNKMGQFSGNSYRSVLTFSQEENGVGDIIVSTASGSNRIANGTGKYYTSSTAFAKEHGSWLVDPKTGQSQPHLTITLDFLVTGILPNTTYQFKDTLVFRNNGVKFENFRVNLIN
jgi:hypothetical protein